MSLIRLGSFAHAIDSLTQLLNYEPGNTKALYLRGKCFMVSGKYQKAIDDLTAAKELKPSSYEIIDRYLEQARLMLLNKISSKPDEIAQNTTKYHKNSLS